MKLKMCEKCCRSVLWAGEYLNSHPFPIETQLSLGGPVVYDNQHDCAYVTTPDPDRLGHTHHRHPEIP